MTHAAKRSVIRSRRTAMICSSVNLFRFIVRPLREAGL
jgi:hypothetical protein